VETLEDRCCPTVSVGITGSTLWVLGDNAANTVSIRDDGQGGIAASIDGQTGTGSGITRVVILTRGGDDTVNYQLTGNLHTPEALQLDLGNGHDQATLDYSPGVSSGDLRVDIWGGAGGDQVTARFGDITSTVLRFNAHLGRGDNTFDATLAGNVFGDARVWFNVNGGPGGGGAGPVSPGPGQFPGKFRAQARARAAIGHDTLGFHANGVTIDPAALLSVNLAGGPGDDTITFDYQGLVRGALTVRADGGAGADAMTANLNVDQGSRGTVNAKVYGGPGSDTLTLNVQDNSGGAGGSTLHRCVALLDGGPGADDLTYTPNVVARHP
jgi:hypothetical protein